MIASRKHLRMVLQALHSAAVLNPQADAPRQTFGDAMSLWAAVLGVIEQRPADFDTAWLVLVTRAEKFLDYHGIKGVKPADEEEE